MEGFLNRYRNITVLLLVILAQLVLLAVQVKNAQDVQLIRVWTVTAVTPLARVLEGFRGGGVGFVRNYFLLRDTTAENRRLKAELDRLKVENIFLKNELSTAERAKALQVFQQQTPSKTLAARVIGVGPGANSHMVFVDRGSLMGVQRGMAVVTPEGIVGKVIAAYPITSEVLLVTDPEFAAGVISQKAQVKGTLKGQGTPQCKVDYVPSEATVETGEWLYTSGDDRIFPRGFPVGPVTSARSGQPFKQLYLEPSGLRHGLEDLLIIISGVHMEIPDTPSATPVYINPPVPAPAQPAAPANPDAAAPPAAARTSAAPSTPGTRADEIRAQYQALGDAQKHTFGTGGPGSKPPDFTKLGQDNGGQAPGNGSQGSGARGQGNGGHGSGAGGQGAAQGAGVVPNAGAKQPANGSVPASGAAQSTNKAAPSPGPRPPAPGPQSAPGAQISPQGAAR
jgi:rod shape-determining protein MreC